MEPQAAGDTMCNQLEAMRCQGPSQKPQLSNVKMVGKRKEGDTFKMKGGFRAQLSALVEFLCAKKAHA